MDVAGGTRATLIPDIQGSVVGTLESSTGALSKTGYQTYGESASTAGSFRYTGQRIDAETDGLYYYRARMYSPALGRFLQPDPIGYAAGANLYAYVNNDPLNATDPTGLAAEQAASAVSSVWNYPLSSTSVPHLLPSCIDPESCIATQQAFGTMTYNAPITLGPDVIAPLIGLASVALPALRAGLAGTAAGGADIAAGIGASEYNYSQTVLNNAATRPYINSPLTIREITSTGTGIPDPGGRLGALRYDVPGMLSRPGVPAGSPNATATGTYQLVIDPNTNTIFHFQFKSGQ